MEPSYISVPGHARLVAELQQLQRHERPRVVEEVAAAAAQGDRSENAEYIYGKKRLREIDRRCRWLQKRLDVLHMVDVSVARPGEERCFFGARVTVEDDNEVTATYVILGEDEIDTARLHISYRCPMGRALLGRRTGDMVEVMAPGGRREVEIIAVTYGL